ncbi:MAG TPA: hypothetical protein VF766_07760, partial [Pyrinomonadaceae bacterium]
MQKLAIGIAASLFFVVWAGAARPTDTARQNKSVAQGAGSVADIFKSQCATCHGKDGRAKTFKAKFNGA